MDEDWDDEIAPGSGVKASSFSYSNSSSSAFKPFSSNDSSSSRPSGFSYGRGRSFNSTSYQRQDRNQNNDRYQGFKSNENDQRPSRNYEDSSGSASQITDHMTINSKSVSSLIGKAGATISNIRDKCDVKIFVPKREEIQDQSEIEVKIIGSKENIEKAKNMIKEVTSDSGYGNRGFQKRNMSEDSRRRDDFETQRESKIYNSDFNSGNKPEYQSPEKISKTETAPQQHTSSSSVGIDWDFVRTQPLQNMSKFKDHPPVVKDFYVEHPDITAMTREETKEFRKQNFNITLDLFEKFSYFNNENNKDKRTPQEKEDYLFDKVPKPVKSIEQAFSRYPGILAECQRQNFINPTPVQCQMWPILLKGVDCVGIAQTGTGT